MPDMRNEEKVTAESPANQGYRPKIGRDIIRVVSVFSGTRTASEVIHEAAVKKILFEKAAG